MKRIALFAHYDRDGIVDDYVIYYLRGLAPVADRILFVSDCELSAGEAAKLEGLAELVFAGRHGEYDFGSWKRGLAHLNYDLAGWDELILANDSCYAPVYPFEDFEKMKDVSCDFWGPTGNGKKSGAFNGIAPAFVEICSAGLAG
jgi:lipopolysaccharide biosynthesis protein